MAFKTSTTPIGHPSPGGAGGALIILGIVGAIAAFSYVLPGILFVANVVWGFVAPVVLGMVYSLVIVSWLPSLTKFSIWFPAFWPAISGVLAGAVIAWIRMAFRSKEKYEPIMSAIFSQEPIKEGGWEFVWRFLADVAVGYLVILIFATFVLVANNHGAPISLRMVDEIMLGGGGSGGFGGPDTIAFLVFMLVFLFFAAAIIAAILGGAIGGGLGFGLWTTHMIHGGAQGATVHLLLAQRRSPGPKKYLLGYILIGGASGAVEAFLVGAMCGCIIDWGYL